MKKTKNLFTTSLRYVKSIVKGLFRRPVKAKAVYFIPGMCYNCKVFDKLTLPEGYVKKYIEWYTPGQGETIEEYARALAKNINVSSPFILVGYSFGAIVMQEMIKYLKPEKAIIISSFKRVEEIPGVFRIIRRIKLLENLPSVFFNQAELLTETFNRYYYHVQNKDLEEYMVQINPIYIKWAVQQIVQWKPDIDFPELYHIHGTKDQIFPYEQIENVFPILDGDHLMVFKEAEKVSTLLASILLMKKKKQKHKYGKRKNDQSLWLVWK